MADDLESALEYIKMCGSIYPEPDMMDEDVKRQYDYCWKVVSNHYAPKKPKKIGKIKQFELDVLECLRQGCGEEQQLLEEAENRQNPYARKKYLAAYYRALKTFQKE